MAERVVQLIPDALRRMLIPGSCTLTPQRRFAHLHAQMKHNGDSHVDVHDVMHATFMQYGYAKLGIGQYWKT